MTKREAARLKARALWIKGCKHDGIDPAAKFVCWSAGNPYDKPYNKAVEKYQRESYFVNSMAL
jgi:hypothetical protein